jgi:hypothetical protein
MRNGSHDGPWKISLTAPDIEQAGKPCLLRPARRQPRAARRLRRAAANRAPNLRRPNRASPRECAVTAVFQHRLLFLINGLKFQGVDDQPDFRPGNELQILVVECYRFSCTRYPTQTAVMTKLAARLGREQTRAALWMPGKLGRGKRPEHTVVMCYNKELRRFRG